jgi:exosortase family protein XrtM
VGIYALLHWSYFQIPNEWLADSAYRLVLGVEVAAGINAIAPNEAVMAIHNHLLSPRADLEIVRGCDGAGALFLVVAAVLAFPAGPRAKLAGLLGSVVLMYTLNLLRIGVLYFVMAYRPGIFTAVHVYLAPTLIVMIACLFFAWWSGSCRTHAPG